MIINSHVFRSFLEQTRPDDRYLFVCLDDAVVMIASYVCRMHFAAFMHTRYRIRDLIKDDRAIRVEPEGYNRKMFDLIVGPLGEKADVSAVAYQSVFHPYRLKVNDTQIPVKPCLPRDFSLMLTLLESHEDAQPDCTVAHDHLARMTSKLPRPTVAIEQTESGLVALKPNKSHSYYYDRKLLSQSLRFVLSACASEYVLANIGSRKPLSIRAECMMDDVHVKCLSVVGSIENEDY